MNGPGFASSAARAALVFGAIAGAAILARRARGAELAAPPIDVELGPVTIDAGGPLVVAPVPRVPPPPPSALDRVSMFLGDAVTSIKRQFLPRGMRNNNPGNIRTIKPASRAWRGQVGDDAGYGIYDEMASGVRALGKQLKAYAARGLVTVEAIVGTWAPPIENVTSSYVAAVAAALGVAPDQRIDVDGRLVDLAAAIIKHENGGAWESFSSPELGRHWTRDELARWVRLP